MLRNGRVTSPGLAWLAFAVALAVAGCASHRETAANRSDEPATGAAVAASGAEAKAPVILTGATLLADGESPRLLLSGAGPLAPAVYSREEGRRVVIDLPDTVASPGLEPPRADGALLAQVEMRSYTELGRPHLRFELVGRSALDSRLAGDPGSNVTAVALVRKPAPEAVTAGPAPAAPPAASLNEPQTVASETASASNPRPSETDPRTEALASGAAVVASSSGSAGAATSEPTAFARHVSQGVAASRLSSVTTARTRSGVAVTLAADGDLAYDAFTLGNPPRFVIDLPGVRNVSKFRNQDLKAGAVSRLRVSQFRTDPTPVTRVVFDLSGDAVPALRGGSRGLVVEFGGTAAPTAAPALVAEAAPRKAAPAENAKPAKSVETVEIAGAAGTAVVASVPAAGSYEAHETEDPHEAVVGERSGSPAAAAPAEVAAVQPKPVEAAAPQAAMAAEVTPTAVVASAQTPPDTAAPAGKTSEVRATEPEGTKVAESQSSPAVPAPAPEAADTAAAPAVKVASAGTAGEGRKVNKETAASAAPAPVASPQVVAASPEVRIPAETVASAPAAAPKAVPAAQRQPRKKRGPSSEDRALIEAAETLLAQQERTGGAKDLQSPYESRTLGAGDRQYTGEPIALNLKDADIKDTLQKFSELTSLNIVLDPDVRGTVTVTLNDIPWDQALELILKINGLGYVLEGNVMRIASTAKLAQEESQRQQLIRAQEQNRPTKTVIQKLSYASAAEASATAKRIMSPRGDIFVDARSNTLIIRELPEYLPTVLDLIKNLDSPVPQVMIEARVVEATRTFLRQLGIDWSFRAVADQAHGNTTGLVFPSSGSVDGTVSLPNGSQVLRLSLANVLDTFRLDMALQAAEARGLVKIVSTPKVQTQTNNMASIQSGFQIPVQTTVNNTTTVLYIDATMRLDVTPQITAEGTIIMTVKIQRREPAPGINIAGGQNIPLITRDASTKLMVRDGGTAVIGGIFKLTANDGQTMIPGLWKIPLLGNLFRNSTKIENTDELMIFITPRVMKTL